MKAAYFNIQYFLYLRMPVLVNAGFLSKLDLPNVIQVKCINYSHLLYFGPTEVQQLNGVTHELKALV